MSIFDAIIQGIIQGLTEFLPVSSSGHLSISKHIFGIEMPGILFDIMLHLGTLIAVVFVYRQLIWRLIKEFGSLCVDIAHRNFKWSEMNHDRRLLFMLMIGLLPLFFLFVPIPGTGLDFKGLSDMLGSDSDILVEGLALLATSALLFAGIAANKRVKEVHRHKDASGRMVSSNGRKKIHTVDAILIGITQCLAAIFPGLSRSGSTLSVGLLRGINQQTALDYSFVLGIPSIAAADAVGAGALVAGIITAAVVGFLAIKLLKWIVTTNKLHIFAFYTLIVGGLVTVIGMIEHITGNNLFTGLPL